MTSLLVVSQCTLQVAVSLHHNKHDQIMLSNTTTDVFLKTCFSRIEQKNTP